MNIKAQKVMIVGVNGSGKTNAGYYLASNQFKRFIFVTPHTEDIKEAPKNSIKVLAKQMTPEELEEIMTSVKEFAQDRKIDGILIDDLDSFITSEADLRKVPTLRDAIVNHRHWGKRNKEDKFGLGMIFMTRRPQNVPSALFEICEHNFFFSSPTSDNVKRKYNAIDENLYQMVSELKYKEYKFVYKEIGKRPKTFKPLPLYNKTVTKSKEAKNEKRNKTDSSNNEDKG